jgi:hypothetical protein
MAFTAALNLAHKHNSVINYLHSIGKKGTNVALNLASKKTQ